MRPRAGPGFARARGCALAAVLLLLVGCAGLPTAGPTEREVIADADAGGTAQFLVVDVTGAVVDRLSRRPKPAFAASFGRFGPPPAPVVAVGDTVSVAIWEAGASLFQGGGGTPAEGAGGGAVTLPPQQVLADGGIMVPFAGRVPVLGRSPPELEAQIARRLVGKTFSPQVIVTVAKGTGYAITLVADSGAAARVPLPPQGERLLDVLAAGGGPKAPTYDLVVTLTRGGLTASVPIEQLVADPADNVYVWPGDVVSIREIKRSFEAFGATGRNAEVPFDRDTLTVAQALARSAGLLDERADPAGVFLLRLEPAALAGDLAAGTTLPRADAQGRVPVVYHFDMSQARSYFYAQTFGVEDSDIVYVADAAADSAQKFLQLLNTLTNPIVTGIFVSNSTH